MGSPVNLGSSGNANYFEEEGATAAANHMQVDERIQRASNEINRSLSSLGGLTRTGPAFLNMRAANTNLAGLCPDSPKETTKVAAVAPDSAGSNCSNRSDGSLGLDLGKLDFKEESPATHASSSALKPREGGSCTLGNTIGGEVESPFTLLAGGFTAISEARSSSASDGEGEIRKKSKREELETRSFSASDGEGEIRNKKIKTSNTESHFTAGALFSAQSTHNLANSMEISTDQPFSTGVPSSKKAKRKGPKIKPAANKNPSKITGKKRSGFSEEVKKGPGFITSPRGYTDHVLSPTNPDSDDDL